MKDKNCNYSITVQKAWEISKSWKKAAIIWRALDHLFVIGAFAASVAVVYVSGTIGNSKEWIIGLSSIAALLTLTGFACNPTRYMSNYRAAFHRLNEALIANTDDQGLVKGKEGYIAIGNAINEGEMLIGRTYEVDYAFMDKPRI